METTKRKPTVDIQNKNRKESKYCISLQKIKSQGKIAIEERKKEL